MATQGGQSLYSPEIASEILERLESGETLGSICKDERYPAKSTIVGWTKPENPANKASLEASGGSATFAEQYARARSFGCDAMAEGIIDIADNQELDPNARRIMVDARKWALSKMRPDKYGDRLELSGQVNLTHSIADILRQREAAITTVAESSMQFLNTSVAATVQPLGVAQGSTEPIIVTSEPVTDAE